jgi:arabinofuranan 3-O-arabinosyltransferase
VRLQSKPELAALAALAYVPFLLSSPGQVSADSKQALYLDPGRFLSHAADLWDPHVGAGTVPHQNLGYLFPTGPWFWVLDQLAVPDWVAQRLWWGTISLAALLGARWLFRQLGVGQVGALAGALVYGLTPYQLAFTARISVLLLPWAALPWLVGLTMRATRTAGWRAPAALAVVLLLAGGVNASSLLLVALAPAVWVVLELARRKVGAGQVAAAVGRIAVLAIGISLWWLVGVRLQARYGLPVLQLTENVRTVAEVSTPGDVLRGIGNWFFYGRDRTGYSIDQAADYATNDLVIVLSYAVPVAALVAALVVRWSHRAYFGLLVVVGTIVAVGAWPIADPSPYGSLWERFASETSVGLAFRNSPRVVPIIVLGLAGLLAAAVGSLPLPSWRRVGGVVVAAVALGALLPVWQDGYLSDGVSRPGELPDYWIAATAAMEAGDHGTRVLEVPGSSFAAYRWGNTVDPITPALIDRPYLAREVLPAGTAASAELLAALDRRMQLGVFEPAALAPIARLLGVGTVALRADLEQEGRFDTPPPDRLWRALTEPAAAGLAPPDTFGPPDGDGDAGDLPSVALFDVDAPRPIVRTAPAVGPVLLGGDGDGLIDAAAAGLLDGSSLVLPATALDDATLQGALDAGAHLVLTDSHRRRIQTWFYSLRDTRGPTERAGETAPDPTGYDFRLEVFPGSDDDSRTIIEQVGGRVESTGGGGPERPEDRAAHAVDGDDTTAWRVGGDPTGQTLTITPAEAVVPGELRLVQSAVPSGGRRLARVLVHVDGGPPMPVDLGPRSLELPGQAVALPGGPVHEVRIELAEIAPATDVELAGSPVGLAEVRLGAFTLRERARLPVDLLRRVGPELDGHSLDIVLTRLRLDLPGQDRRDDEARLDRRVDLPTARGFSISGLARAVGGGASPGPECRTDLLIIGGAPVPVRLTPQGGDLRVEGCAPVALADGSHEITAIPGSESGIDLDRLVLSSGVDGGAAPVAPRGASAADGAAQVVVERDGSSALDLTVESDGEPFWLVLAQSSSDGWHAGVDGGTVGDRQLVDGYANGWLVTPDGPGTLSVDLRWRPQRLVWAGLAASAVTLAAVAVILWRTRGRPAPDLSAAPRPMWRTPWVAGPGLPWVVASAVLVGGGSLAVATPAVAVVGAALTVIAGLAPGGRLLLVAAAPAALVLSRLDARPSLAWLAVAALAADLLLEARRRPA